MSYSSALAATLSCKRVARFTPKKCSTKFCGSRKRILGYVTRRFNLSSARLNKPQGLGLR